MGGSGATMVTQWGAAWLKTRGDRHQFDRTADAKLEEHRDALTFQLLEAARAEVAQARMEVAQLRPLEQHLYHFQQALEHIEAMLSATDPAERGSAERNARAFLNRMRRLSDARGTAANEAQRAESVLHVAERKIPGKDEKGKS
ncbi:hypothetical protein U1769_24100 [Sphingomonas sp. ZT3P38]|uniref:hypothetical protein n=1 Tax=Parasphingomonas zepuensis TaxID=3096161 RepID=UPI002FCA86B1